MPRNERRSGHRRFRFSSQVTLGRLRSMGPVVMLPGSSTRRARRSSARFGRGARRNCALARRRESGLTMLLVAVLMLVILGFAGLAVDLSRLYTASQQLQA